MFDLYIREMLCMSGLSVVLRTRLKKDNRILPPWSWHIVTTLGRSRLSWSLFLFSWLQALKTRNNVKHQDHPSPSQQQPVYPIPAPSPEQWKLPFPAPVASNYLIHVSILWAWIALLSLIGWWVDCSQGWAIVSLVIVQRIGAGIRGTMSEYSWAHGLGPPPLGGMLKWWNGCLGSDDGIYISIGVPLKCSLKFCRC